MTPSKLVGVIVGLIGVAVLVGVDALEGLEGRLVGQLSILGAAACYAFGVIFFKRISHYPAQVSATAMLICAAAIMAPVAFLFGDPIVPDARLESVASVVAIALFSTAFAYLLFMRLIRTAGATNAILVTFLNPVTALLLGLIVLHEAVQIRSLLGMLVIFSGLALVDGRVVGLLLKRIRAR